MRTRKSNGRLTTFLAVWLLLLALAAPAFGQRGFGRGGSFGGGFGRSSSPSFGRSSGSSGGFGRSSGSFGGRSGSYGRSYGGFGGGTATRPSSPGFGSSRPSTGSGAYRAPGSGSFGRSGQFGGTGRINSTSINPNNRSYSYGGQTYTQPIGTYSYGGRYVPGFGTGMLAGYSLGILSSPWTHYVPFHPGFYVSRPYYDPVSGAYYGGGFSFTRFIFGLVLLGAIFWFVRRLFRGGGGGGGGRNIRFTTYR